MSNDHTDVQTDGGTAQAGGAATLIIGQRIQPGREAEYQRWQRTANAEAAKFPGHVGADVRPPSAARADWLAVYQFDSISHVQDWLNSDTRLRLVQEAGSLFDGPGTVQVLAEGHREPDTLVTVVIGHKVAPERRLRTFHCIRNFYWKKIRHRLSKIFPKDISKSLPIR